MLPSKNDSIRRFGSALPPSSQVSPISSPPSTGSRFWSSRLFQPSGSREPRGLSIWYELKVTALLPVLVSVTAPDPRLTNSVSSSGSGAKSCTELVWRSAMSSSGEDVVKDPHVVDLPVEVSPRPARWPPMTRPSTDSSGSGFSNDATSRPSK